MPSIEIPIDSNTNNDYANKFMKIPYLNKKNIKPNKDKYLKNNVERSTTIGKLNEVLYDIDASILIEAGLYEFTLTYGLIHNITKLLLPAIYKTKLDDDILKNIVNPINTLKERILGRTINLQQIAFLRPEELNPPNWNVLVERHKFREAKRRNNIGTNLYKCFKCGERKCQIYQIQTRSADEPITNFVTCLICYNTFKG